MKSISWKVSTSILASVYALRMLGMFMIFPVFSLYAINLQGASKFTVGIALGVYGLTQGLLQIPFGRLSDRYGRRLFMLIGLALFVLGSVVAALATDIHWMIVGRTIQGMGAISAVTLAYGTDVVPEEKRGTMMAIIGGSIGMAFVLSLIIGPLLAGWFGVSGLFWIIAGLCVVAMIAVAYLPNASSQIVGSEKEAVEMDHKALAYASIAIFLTHAIFTSTFLVLPFLLQLEGLVKLHHWWVYLPANLIALGFMRYKATPHAFNFGVSFFILALGLALMSTGFSIWGLGIAVTIYFIAFYRLETGLPHWVANIASINGRGKAMGIYSTSQFMGSFIGAVLSGILWQQTQSPFIVLIALLIASGLSGLFLLSVAKKDTLHASKQH